MVAGALDCVGVGGPVSTRRERKNRWWLRCPNCKAWLPTVHKVEKRGGHLNPFTKTYICEKKVAP